VKLQVIVFLLYIAGSLCFLAGSVISLLNIKT
jgi:hypothetical protein